MRIPKVGDKIFYSKRYYPSVVTEVYGNGHEFYAEVHRPEMIEKRVKLSLVDFGKLIFWEKPK